MRRHEHRLLTDDVWQLVPSLRCGEAVADLEARVKFFLPGTPRVWLASQGDYDGGDFRFYGYVIGPGENDWRTFWLSELEHVRGPQGQVVERDLNFLPVRMSEVLRRRR